MDFEEDLDILGFLWDSLVYSQRSMSLWTSLAEPLRGFLL